MAINLIDFAVVVYLLFCFASGFKNGFFSVLVGMVVFVLALIFALFTYSFSSDFFSYIFGFRKAYSNVLGFFLNIFIAKTAVFILMRNKFFKKIPQKGKSATNRFAGAVMSSLYGTIVVFLIFSITLSFSLPYFIVESINFSKAGEVVSQDPLRLNDDFRTIFGDVLRTTIDELSFLTVKTGDAEKVELGFKLFNFEVNGELEKEMVELVNQERSSRGLRKLVVDEKIRESARKHGEDMFKNGYFSHINLEGESPDGRIGKENVKFNFSGENLAFSQNIVSAHEGLMNSPGHRENILNPFFYRIGVGAIDGGEYGIIFVQNFAD